MLQADLYNKLSQSKVIQEAALRSGIAKGAINRRTKQEQSQACLSYALQEGGKPKVNAAWDAIGEVKDGLQLTAYGLRERDTLKVERVTHRELESGSRFKAQSSKVEVRTVRDTVYVEKSEIAGRARNEGSSLNPRPSTLNLTLKWICFILLGLIALIITAKVCLRR